MDPKLVLHALLRIWHELPRWLGAKWAEIYPQVEPILHRLAATDDAAERSALTRDLVKLAFHPYPAARKRLHEAIGQVRDRTKSPAPDQPGSEPSWTQVRRALGARLDGTLTRYTGVTSPRQLSRHRRRAITVALTRDPQPDSVGSVPLEVAPDGAVIVHLRSSSPGLEVVGDPVRPLEVGEDTPPVVYFVRGETVGTKRLSVDFHVDGSWACAIEWELEVVEGAALGDYEQVPPVRLRCGSYAPPADLEIRVTLRHEAEGRRLSYTLHSEGKVAPFFHQEVPGLLFPYEADVAHAAFVEEMRALVREDVNGGVPAARRKDALEKIGHRLHRELFSEALMDAYRLFRDRVKTIQIVSDEPRIPWEMIKPYDDREVRDVVDDDFLCVRFQLARWLSGDAPPEGRIQVRRAVFVDVAETADDRPERRFFTQLEASHPGLEVLVPDPPKREAVEALLDAGGVDLWHFSAEGTAEPVAIRLPGGAPLAADDIHGRRQTHIIAARPLIFLNVGEAAQQDWSLTRLRGWCATLVERCRCGALVAPHWQVDDVLKADFAVHVYGGLRRGWSLGHSVQAAREVVRSQAPGDLTWLAYSVYGHPNGLMVILGSDGGRSSSWESDESNGNEV